MPDAIFEGRAELSSSEFSCAERVRFLFKRCILTSDSYSSKEPQAGVIFGVYTTKSIVFMPQNISDHHLCWQPVYQIAARSAVPDDVRERDIQKYEQDKTAARPRYVPPTAPVKMCLTWDE
jgi:hypothetical protein